MATNLKYAELPGFVHDQPDIYESEDLPESDQLESVDDSEAVEILHVTTKDAYNRFKHSRLDTSKTDFTENILPTKSLGYSVIHGEWEINDDKENESLPQRYHRIKTEVKQFLEDVTAIEREKRPDNHEVLLADMEMLEQLLADVNLESVIGDGASGDSNLENTKNLLKRLSLLQANSEDSAKEGTDAKGVLTYELFYKPEYNKLQQGQRVAALEERLRQLETIVGEDKPKLSLLCAQTAGKSLQDVCDELSSKLYLLDPANVERVESQLAGLQERLLAVSERKQAIEEAQKSDKITQMYEVARKVDHLIPGLANVLQTLASLQELHEHALQFSKCLTMLEGQQTIFGTQLKNDEELLNEVKDSFKKDIVTVAENMSKLEERMKAFQK